MTAATETDERRVALAMIVLVPRVVAMGASVMFVRWADVAPCASASWRVLLALRRAGQLEVGP